MGWSGDECRMGKRMGSEDLEKPASPPLAGAARVIHGYPGHRPGLLDFYDELFSGTVDITLYIPVLNEEQGICGTLDTIAEAARQTGITYEADVFVPCHRTIMGKSRSRILLSRAFATLVRLLSGHKPRYYNGGNCYRRP